MTATNVPLIHTRTISHHSYMFQSYLCHPQKVFTLDVELPEDGTRDATKHVGTM